MHNQASMSAWYSALAEYMNSFSAETKIELKVRYSNLAETEIWPKLEIWPVLASKPKPKQNFGQPLIYIYVHIYIYIYIHIHIYIHTYIHIYIYIYANMHKHYYINYYILMIVCENSTIHVRNFRFELNYK